MNRTYNTAIIALLFITAAGLTSCKKDLRTKQYTMSAYNSSGVSGTVEFQEQKDGNTVIHTHMMGVTSGASYQAHIHTGPITMPGGVSIDLGPFNATSSMVEGDKEVSTDYDDMIDFDGCFVAHNPTNFADYVLVGNIGKNAP